MNSNRPRGGSNRPHPRGAGRGICAVVRSLEEARAALSQAAARGAAATLVSPPGAAAYLGAGFFWALVEAARAERPELAVEAVMDCGGDPGFALAALRTGFKAVVLDGDRRARARVAAIARAMGARLLARPPRATAVGEGARHRMRRR